MEAQGSATEVRRLHIVYFLSRNGGIDHPHLIRVHHASRNGVRLRDVKRWLAELRGKDIPDSFSWSYKRRYKSGYIWQDLLDEDLITPISDNEFVLKGSEISSSSLNNNKDRSHTQDQVGMQKEPLSLEVKSQKPSCNQEIQTHSADVSTKTPSEIDQESPTFGSETSTLTDDSVKLEIEPEPEKNSTTLTQKQETMYCCNDQEQKLPSKELKTERQTLSLNSALSIEKDKKTMNDKARMWKNSSASASSEASSTKSKSSGASNMFKNLISCKGVDTNDSAVVMINRKNKPLLNMCSSDPKNVHSAEIWKREKVPGGAQRIFGTSWNQQQWKGRRSLDGDKDSRKQRTPPMASKPIRGPNCSQCGKSFKPEKLHSHMKSCKGMKALSRGTSQSFSASIVQTTSQRSSKESENKELSGYYLTR